jgi:predicted transcriptional regulator
MKPQALLISIRPRYAEMIFKGTKLYELRRVCPRVRKGDIALVYVSSPSMELQGAFEIAEIVSDSPTKLWARVGNDTGLTQTEFLSYFREKKRAHAIRIKRAWKLSEPIALASLREDARGFSPPQSYRYVSSPKMPRKLGARLGMMGKN